MNEITLSANNYIFNLILILVIALISLIGFTASFKTRRTNWGNFWTVFLLTAVVSSIIITLFIMSPEWLFNQLIKFKDFIGI